MKHFTKGAIEGVTYYFPLFLSFPRRSTSFKDEFIRPVVRPRVNRRVRALSEERYYDEEE